MNSKNASFLLSANMPRINASKRDFFEFLSAMFELVASPAIIRVLEMLATTSGDHGALPMIFNTAQRYPSSAAKIASISLSLK